MTDRDLLLLIKNADPLDAVESDQWWRDHDKRGLVGRIYSEPEAVLAPSGNKRRLAVALGAAVAVVGGTVGVAVAAGLLGGPAPDPVKAHLAELDRGMPQDLRYDPDLNNARAVAAEGAAVLYLADLKDGGYCIEVTVSGTRPRGASCVSRDRLGGLGLDVTAPIPAPGESVLVVAGRANDERIRRIRVTFPGGTAVAVPFGLDRTWLLQVPVAARSSVLAQGLTVRGLDSAGREVASVSVPALHDDDPMGTAHDADQPVVVETISDGSDLSRVLGIRGRVNATGSVILMLEFPDGTQVPVPVAADGTYHLTLAADRRDDFESSAGRLILLSGGSVVDSTAVYSVAAWRAQHG